LHGPDTVLPAISDGPSIRRAWPWWMGKTTSTYDAWAQSGSRLIRTRPLPEHGLGAPTQFTWRNILDMGGQRPHIAVRVAQAAGTVTVEHVLGRHQRLGTGGHGLAEEGIDIVHIQVQPQRGKIPRRARNGRVPWLAQHEASLVHLEFGMPYPSIGPTQAHDFLGAKRLFVELNGLTRMQNAQVRRNSGVTVWYRFDSHGHVLRADSSFGLEVEQRLTAFHVERRRPMFMHGAPLTVELAKRRGEAHPARLLFTLVIGSATSAQAIGKCQFVIGTDLQIMQLEGHGPGAQRHAVLPVLAIGHQSLELQLR